MVPTHFDDVTRSLTGVSSRRRVLTRFAGVALAATAARFPGLVEAKHKKKNQKLSRNTFGCVDVGQKCAGENANCCSGMCQGKKPKKGKPDKSRCVAHNTGSCTAAQDVCTENGEASCGSAAWCYRTTGNAGFCGSLDSECTVCAKDADCDVLGFGPGAACVFCTIGCLETNHTVCIGPAAL